MLTLLPGEESTNWNDDIVSVGHFICLQRKREAERHKNIRVRERHKPKIETKDTAQKTYWIKNKQRSGACIHLSSGAIQFKNKYLSIGTVA